MSDKSDKQLSLRDLRIVENVVDGLRSLDEDCDIMGVPLRLDERCDFSFDKHIEAIVAQEEEALKAQKQRSDVSYAQENQREWDRRYKERPMNRVRFVKR